LKDYLDKPLPIIFAVCQGVQQLTNGAFNLLGVFDKITVYKLPDGTRPDAFTVQIVTAWTGGRGDFEEVIGVLDEDGNRVGEARTAFALPATNHRHYNISVMALPAKEGILTLTVARADEELLRQDFTVEVAEFPGAHL
jgi:hypothetical protein